MMIDFSITECDAVIAWVDGNDPKHLFKKAQALKALGLISALDLNGTKATRFANNGEIYYCVASILKYAPFVRRIYIVTDAQTPEGIEDFYKQNICAKDRIQIIDHTVLFESHPDVLPTFNSLTIETMLWNIPKLSNYFIYFNDDFFFNSKVDLSNFITNQGKLKIFGKKRSTRSLLIKKQLRDWRYKYLYPNKTISAHFKTSQVLSAQLAGLNFYVELGHTPHVLDRRTLSDFFVRRPNVLKEQIKYKFRSINQFLPVGLSNHIEIKHGRAQIEGVADCVYIKPNNINLNQIERIQEDQTMFGCIQSLDELNKNWQKTLHETMIAKFKSYLPTTVLDSISAAWVKEK